jgi:hypothetical protein
VEAYLGEGVARSSDVLLAVVGNELVDLGARQGCVDALLAGELPPEAAAQLAEVVSSPVGAGLRAPEPAISPGAPEIASEPAGGDEPEDEDE